MRVNRWKYTVLPPCWVSTHLLCPWARQLQYKRGSYMRSWWDDSCILPQHERQAAPKLPFSLNVERYQLGEKEKKTSHHKREKIWFKSDGTEICVSLQMHKNQMMGKKTAQGGFSNVKEAGGISGKNWLRTTCDIHLLYYSWIWGDKMKKKKSNSGLFCTILQLHYFIFSFSSSEFSVCYGK